MEPFLQGEDDGEVEGKSEEETSPSYTLANIISEGCFLPQRTLETIVQRLADKKTSFSKVHRGPEDLARQEAWLCSARHARPQGSKSANAGHSIPSVAFIRGFRAWLAARKSGGLALIDGFFLEIVQAAIAAGPDLPFVLIIEEINRAIQLRSSAKCSPCWKTPSAAPRRLLNWHIGAMRRAYLRPSQSPRHWYDEHRRPFSGSR